MPRITTCPRCKAGYYVASKGKSHTREECDWYLAQSPPQPQTSTKGKKK